MAEDGQIDLPVGQGAGEGPVGGPLLQQGGGVGAGQEVRAGGIQQADPAEGLFVEDRFGAGAEIPGHDLHKLQIDQLRPGAQRHPVGGAVHVGGGQPVLVQAAQAAGGQHHGAAGDPVQPAVIPQHGAVHPAVPSGQLQQLQAGSRVTCPRASSRANTSRTL